MTEYLKKVLANFKLDGTGVTCERYGYGHINETYLVVTDRQKRYILQKINNTIFKDVDALMANIEAVTTYLRRQTEDKRMLSKIEMSLELYETYTRGFLSACPGLTPTELEMLPMGAKLMTLECGVRFLTDYLDGDHYFANRREGQNLDRCRTQFKLVADMETKWEQMHQIVKELTL